MTLGVMLENGSREEVEIRGVTIEAVEVKKNYEIHIDKCSMCMMKLSLYIHIPMISHLI